MEHPSGYEYAAERSIHPEGKAFREWFTNLLWDTDTCFHRDILRDNQDNLWLSWKEKAKEWDENINSSSI